MKTQFPQNANVRSISATVTNADPDAGQLFELPAGSQVLGVDFGVVDAFNTSATCKVGTVADDDLLVTAQAVDALGLFRANMAHALHTTEPTTFTATISDKTAAGAVEISVLFSMDTDTDL